MARSRSRPALARANQLRDDFRARGEFDHKDFVEALHAELRCYEDEAYDGFVNHIAEQVDRAATREAAEDAPGQQYLSKDWDLGGEYRLDDGKRIAKRLARKHHQTIAIRLAQENLDAVQGSLDQKRAELERLAPYWGPDMTKEEAVAEYCRLHQAG